MIEFMYIKNIYKIILLTFIFFNWKLSLANEEFYNNNSELVIAFGSCNDQSRSQLFWKNINSFNPDIFIMLGDNIYPELGGNIIDKLSKAYDDLAKNKFYKDFINSVPILAIWDDHDYGVNDGGADFLEKDKSKKLFLNFFNLSNHKVLKNRKGLYREKILIHNNKIIQIIMLDTRYFKSPFKITDERGKIGKERYVTDYDKSKTILGFEQWEWLEQKLSIDVDVRLIITSIQLIASDHGWEKWGNFPLELNKFYSYIENSNLSNTIILSGDRHIGGLYEQILVNKYKLIELTSSSLNKPLPFKSLEKDSKQLGRVINESNFGIIKINWEKEDIILELRSSQKHSLAQEKPFIFKKLKLYNY